MNQKYKSVDMLELIECFKILDPEKKGFVELATLKELFGNNPNPFDDEEWNMFKEFGSSEKHPDRIYYNEYILNFKEVVVKHLTKLGNMA